MPRKGKRGNGEGSIVKRPDGRWEGRIRLPDGSRPSYYGATRQEVMEKLADVRLRIANGLPAPKRQAFGQYLDGWLEQVARPRLKRSTYERYKLDIDRVPDWLRRLQLTEVTPQHIQQVLNELTEMHRPRTVIHFRAVLRTALNEAMTWGLVIRNAAALATPPRDDAPPREGMTKAEAQEIIAAFAGSSHLYALVVTALATGLRRNELLGLQWSDVDLDAGRLDVRHQLGEGDGAPTLTSPKTEPSYRSIPLPNVAIEALRKERVRIATARLRSGPNWVESGHVFVNRRGLPLDPENTTHRFQEHLARHGIMGLRFHDLRHGAASLWLAQGVSLKTVSYLLGHSSISVTSKFYAHLVDELKTEAASLMDDALTRPQRSSRGS